MHRLRGVHKDAIVDAYLWVVARGSIDQRRASERVIIDYRLCPPTDLVRPVLC